MKIRPRLGEIIKERSLTQLALSEQSGVPQAAISRFDKSTQHKDEHLFMISRALGLKVDDLFEVVDEEKEQEG